MAAEYLGNVTPGVVVHWFRVGTEICGIRVTRTEVMDFETVEFINQYCNEMEYNSNTAARLQALHDAAKQMGLPV